MTTANAVAKLIRQINYLLSQLDPVEFRKPLPEFDGSSLGQHFRHILEFFNCLENGISTGEIDYASRQRNLLYEDYPQLAHEAFALFSKSLESFDCQQVVPVRGEFGESARPVFDSTVGRELMFVYDHAIHHLAMIKIGLSAHFPEVKTAEDLGVSPSTLKYRQQQAN